tara:strand:+ start:78 stop:1391 length:1314 start_codon:yes stop_codon:yes gene_type:complete
MKKLLLLLCVPLIGLGQGWEKTFGGPNWDDGRSVQQTTDGGYIICGKTQLLNGVTGDYDVYLIKTDGNGNEQWSQTFGSIEYDAGHSVQQTTDGGYIICGKTNGYNFDADVYLIKTDAYGDSIWTKTFGDIWDEDEGNSVQQTTDGGYIITGMTSADIYLIKTDGNGDSSWTKTFTFNAYTMGNSVQQTTDGGYIIIGTTSANGGNGNWDSYLMKTDAYGDSIWTKTFGGGLIHMDGMSGQQTSDGGYIITGGTGIDLGGGIFASIDLYLMKTDAYGDSIWTKTFGGSGNSQGYSVQQTTDGGYIIVGSSRFNGYDDVYLIKTDANGIDQWNQSFPLTGTFNNDKMPSIRHDFDVQQTTDGGYIITGAYYLNGPDDVYLIKTDGNGNITSTFNIPINTNRELKKVVDILGRDINPEKNKPFIEIYNDGTVEKKIIIE